jgi:UDP-3-O-[3-hydroxymyristoyl] glucosamine N-acyltransferase LpxD
MMTADIHPTAFVAEGVELGDGVVVGPHATIDGAGARIVIGDRCMIGPGARIGQAGFGYFADGPGIKFTLKTHDFGVVLEEDVSIGANTCIDRGSWRDTVIGAGSKIDNLVHIAHNVIVGKRCLIVAQAEISGSVMLGNDAYIAPGALVRERLLIGACSVVGMGAVVTKDVPTATTVAGVPARVIGPANGPPPPPAGHES